MNFIGTLQKVGFGGLRYEVTNQVEGSIGGIRGPIGLWALGLRVLGLLGFRVLGFMGLWEVLKLQGFGFFVLGFFLGTSRGCV